MAVPPNSRRLHMLAQYREAVQWLETAAEECHKTHNVDLQKLITHSESCAHCVQQIMIHETNPTRMAALEQLAVTLSYHREVLVAKKGQLESATFSTAAGMAGTMNVLGRMEFCSGNSQPVDDEHSRRRLRAIEDTMRQPTGVWFDSVAGLDQAKQSLREAIILPVRYPHLFTGGRQPWRRILLYGPPGTGKTRLAQAVSGEIESSFYCVSSSDLISSWVGESEKMIRCLFQHARQSEGKAVVFIDEIDSICRQRNSKEEEHTRRIKTELLRQMEGADHDSSQGDMFLLCATNCPWELDTAFLRRFQKRIYIPLPCRKARRRLLEIHLGSTKVNLSESNWELLVTRTEGYSGSDIAVCVSDALLEPIRELETAKYWRPVNGGQMYVPCGPGEPGAVRQALCDLLPQQVCPREMSVGDFLTVLENNRRTVGEEDLAKYQEFTQRFGQPG